MDISPLLNVLKNGVKRNQSYLSKWYTISRVATARKGLNRILPVLTNPLVERGGVDLQISGYLSNRLVAAGYQVNRLDLEFTGVRPSLRNHVSPPDVVVAAFRTVHNLGGRSLF